MITKDYFGYDNNSFDIVTDKLKSIWNSASNLCVSFGYARAASELSRAGLHNEARSLIMELKNK